MIENFRLAILKRVRIEEEKNY